MSDVVYATVELLVKIEMPSGELDAEYAGPEGLMNRIEALIADEIGANDGIVSLKVEEAS